MWHDKHKTECLRIKDKIYRTEKLMKGTIMKKMMMLTAMTAISLMTNAQTQPAARDSLALDAMSI